MALKQETNKELSDEEMIGLIEAALDEMKAKDIVKIDVRGRSTVTDYMIVASGNSKRHVSAVAQSVLDKIKEQGIKLLGVEGQDVGDWVLVDVGSIVVHLMMPDARSFYDIERLWSFGQED